MNNMVDLVLQCVIVFPVSVSEAENSDACRKIQIFFPIRVIEMNPLTSFEYNRKTVVRVKNILIGFLHDFFSLHD